MLRRLLFWWRLLRIASPKRLCLWLLAASLLLGGTAALWAQVGARPAESWEWRSVEGRPGEWALLACGRHVGSYDEGSAVYLPRDGDGWGAACEVPAEAPAPPGCRCRNFGMDYRGPEAAGPKYTLNGKECDREAVVHALAGGAEGKVPDDSRAPRVLYVGPPESRAKFEADVKGPLAEAVRGYVCQSRDPAAWDVAKYGFKADSTYVLAPDGKVLHRGKGYDPDSLAHALAALREPHPDYEPDADPDLSSGAVPGAGGLGWADLIAGVASAGVIGTAGLVEWRRRRKGVAA